MKYSLLLAFVCFLLAIYSSRMFATTPGRRLYYLISFIVDTALFITFALLYLFG